MPAHALGSTHRPRFWPRCWHRFWHRFWRQLWTAPLQRAAVVRSRRQLALLDDHLLRDIGLTRHEAEAEAALPPWEAPPHWHRAES